MDHTNASLKNSKYVFIAPIISWTKACIQKVSAHYLRDYLQGSMEMSAVGTMGGCSQPISVVKRNERAILHQVSHILWHNHDTFHLPKSIKIACWCDVSCLSRCS